MPPVKKDRSLNKCMNPLDICLAGFVALVRLPNKVLPLTVVVDETACRVWSPSAGEHLWPNTDGIDSTGRAYSDQHKVVGLARFELTI